MRLTLHELGLNSKEIDIYLALLEMDKASASIIAYRTRIPASTVHYVCKKLNEKGLVCLIKEEHFIIYKAEPLDKVLYLFKQQEEDIKEKQVRAFKLISELKAKMYPHRLLPKINLCQGLEGIKLVFEGMIKSQKTISVLMSNSMDIKTVHFEKENIQKKVKSNINTHVIAPKHIYKNFTRAQQKKQRLEIKYLEKLPIQIEMNIYGERVAIINYKKINPFAILIQDAALANSMQSMFDFYWHLAQ